jgi:hypothetical protein
MADHQVSARVLLAALVAVTTGCGAARGARSPYRYDSTTVSADAPAVRTSHVHFVDHTSIAIKPSRPENLQHETQAAANIIAFQSLERAGSGVRTDTVGANGVSPWRWAHMGMITPNFVIRQLDDSSAAVRTPSFNPRGRYQLFRMRKAAAPGVSANVNRWRHVDVRFYDLEYAHYSNGQAGCFYERQRYVLNAAGTDYVCEWIANDSSDRAINFSDGSFSSWYLRLGYGTERHWSFGDEGAPSRSHVGLFGFVQFSPPFQMEDPQEPLYGYWRTRVEGEYEKWYRRWGGTTMHLRSWYERAIDGASELPKDHVTAQLSVSFDRAWGLGGFARYRDGQDYYNIAFPNRLSVWQFGLIFRVDQRDSFAP